MNILVINCGSSSIKFALLYLDEGQEETRLAGLLERIGESESRLSIGKDAPTTTAEAVQAPDHSVGFTLIFQALRAHIGTETIDAIGHRVVHGGTAYDQATLVDDSVIGRIRALIPLAPLHNPANLQGIEVCCGAFPVVPQVAVFDTAFHQSLPPEAYRYAIPQNWYEETGIRRYGFHGTAHQYLAEQAGAHLGKPSNLITLHLGNGASITAIRQGVSVETSMGFTPLEGLIMGTRSGDVDPAAVLAAARRLGVDRAEAALLNDSGLKAYCGSNDLRDILTRADQGDNHSLLALDAYCHRIRKYLGAYYAILGQVDALVFSGGIGENAAAVRERVCRGLENLGIRLDPAANLAKARPDIHRIGAAGSPVDILVIKANEELAIARQTHRVLRKRHT